MNKTVALWIACFCFAFASTMACAAETTTKPAGATNISGTWDFVVVSEQGTGTPVFTFKQDGAKLSGTYKGQFGEAPVTGTIRGNAVAFSVNVNAGEEVKIEYTGTVDGAAMKGTTKFGSEGEGTFTAKKRAAK